MSRVDDRLDSIPGSEVDQCEGAQTVVGLNMAGDDVNGRLSPSPAEPPGDAGPFWRGIFCGGGGVWRETEGSSKQPSQTARPWMHTLCRAAI